MRREKHEPLPFAIVDDGVLYAREHILALGKQAELVSATIRELGGELRTHSSTSLKGMENQDRV